MRAPSWSTTALSLILWTSSAYSELFLLGDVTPVYPLTPQPPAQGGEPTVEGNQELFRRLLDGRIRSRVAIWHGKHFPDHAVGELYGFYTYENARVDDFSAFSPQYIDLADLLIVGFPDWSWTGAETASVSTLLQRGKHVLIILEPHVCLAVCIESTRSLLQALGSELRIGPETSGGNQWALLADHELMRGIGPISYGATLTVEGGTALMFQTKGMSMFSVDESIKPQGL